MVRRIRVLALLLGVASAMPSWSFFDDFLGNELGSNWGTSGLARTYEIAESKLTVTSVTYQGGEDSYANFFSTTGYADEFERSDFSARIRLNWQPGVQSFLFTVGNFFSGGYGYLQFQMFGYRDVRYLTFVTAGGYERSTTLELDPGGTYDLGMSRVNGRITAIVNGSPFFSTQNSNYFGGQNVITLSYVGEFADAPLSADYVELVVPEPVTFLATGSLLLQLIFGRKRRSR